MKAAFEAAFLTMRDRSGKITFLKKSHCFFHHSHINAGVYTGSMRTIVDNTVYRYRMSILDAKGKIPFTSYCNYTARFEARHAAACKGPAVYHLNVQTVFLSQFNKFTYLAPAAPAAITDVIG